MLLFPEGVCKFTVDLRSWEARGKGQRLGEYLRLKLNRALGRQRPWQIPPDSQLGPLERLHPRSKADKTLNSPYKGWNSALNLFPIWMKVICLYPACLPKSKENTLGRTLKSFTAWNWNLLYIDTVHHEIMIIF